METDPPIRRFLPHDAPHWVPEWEPFFITICCQPRGKNQLCLQPTSRLILQSIREGEKQKIWHIGLVVLMPDHLHGIFHFNPVPGMKVSVVNWKKLMARKLKIKWQRDFFDHRLRNDAEYSLKYAYISQNPIRAGLTKDVHSWPHQWPKPKREDLKTAR